MVLTNFECWAHGDPATAANFETGTLRPAIDPFNPRAVTHLPAAFITDADANNNNSINSSSNHLSGPPMQEVVMPMEVRCKKRLNPNDPTGGDSDVDHPMYTKRCRYDDVDLAAQYCNDFFSLPATKIIGTQACLMDYEMQANGGSMMEAEAAQSHDHHQQHQQQQQQLLHQRIHQHYQEPAEQQAEPRKRKSRNDLDLCKKIQKCNAKCSETEADLYIATHGGCLHHFRKLSGTEQEESDI